VKRHLRWIDGRWHQPYTQHCHGGDTVYHYWIAVPKYLLEMSRAEYEQQAAIFDRIWQAAPSAAALMSTT